MEKENSSVDTDVLSADNPAAGTDMPETSAEAPIAMATGPKASKFGMTGKVSAIVISAVLVACLTVSIPSYFSAKQQIIHEEEVRLAALSEVRTEVIVSYLNSIVEDIKSVRVSEQTHAALREFT